MASRCSSERKGPQSLTLNQKLETITLSDEGMSKANIGRKLVFLCQRGKPSSECKGKFLKKIGSATPVNTWMIKKKSKDFLQYGESFSSPDRRVNQSHP